MAVYLNPGSRIRDYTLTTELRASDAGTSLWGFASRDGFEYFIKCYLTPVFPGPATAGSERTKRRKRQQCQEFECRMALQETTLADCGANAFLVRSVDFFRDGGNYFRVTRRVFSKPLHVCELGCESVLMILLTACYALRVLHEQSNFVHADIKPENLIIERGGKNHVAWLTDFDSGFYRGHCPPRGQVAGDPAYWAPEMIRYLCADSNFADSLTQSLDIFSMGVTCCVFLTGELPGGTEDYASAAEALLDGVPCSVGSIRHPQLEPLRPVVKAMLSLDPSDRPTASAVHEQLRNLNKRLFVHDSTYRNLAGEVGQGMLNSGGQLVESVSDSALGDAVHLPARIGFRTAALRCRKAGRRLRRLLRR